jgi:hypothetical protein
MRPHEPNVQKLIEEAKEARLRKLVLEATGEDVLDRARSISRDIEQRVRQVTAPAGPSKKQMDRHRPG